LPMFAYEPESRTEPLSSVSAGPRPFSCWWAILGLNQ
jgi:hypothetical protein